MAREKIYFYFLALDTKKVADPCFSLGLYLLTIASK